MERKDSLAGLSQKPTDPRKQGKNFSQNNKLGTRPHIPGGHAWASLKQKRPRAITGPLVPYPRRTRLGLIEAARPCSPPHHVAPYPRRTRLGLIEASTRKAGHQKPSRHIPGGHAWASLKHGQCGPECMEQLHIPGGHAWASLKPAGHTQAARPLCTHIPGGHAWASLKRPLYTDKISGRKLKFLQLADTMQRLTDLSVFE